MEFTQDEIGELKYLVEARMTQLEEEMKNASRMKNISISQQEEDVLQSILDKLEMNKNNVSGGNRKSRKSRKTRKNRKD